MCFQLMLTITNVARSYNEHCERGSIHVQTLEGRSGLILTMSLYWKTSFNRWKEELQYLQHDVHIEAKIRILLGLHHKLNRDYETITDNILAMVNYFILAPKSGKMSHRRL